MSKPKTLTFYKLSNNSWVVQYKAGLPIANLLQDFAFHMSKDSHKETRPESPTAAWSGVYQRYHARKK